MILLPSQKDEIFDLIESVGLSPVQFEFKNITIHYGTVKDNHTITQLKYKNSDYYFLFKTGREIDIHLCKFSPGSGSFHEEGNPKTWESQILHVQLWLYNLVRELKTPNKWDRLKKEYENISFNFINERTDSEKFTFQDCEEIKVRMLSLKQGLSKTDILEEHLIIINSKLDHLTELSKEMNKFDWRSLVIGTILSIIIQLGLTPQNTQTIWTLIKLYFSNHLFLLP